MAVCTVGRSCEKDKGTVTQSRPRFFTVPVFSTGSKRKGFGQMPGGGEKHIGVFVEHLGRGQDPHLPAEAEDPAKEDMVDRNRLLLFSITISPL